MKNPFQRLFRARDKPRDAVSGALSFFFGSSASGKSVNPQNAIQMSAVYACVRVISETIASLPLGVYEDTDDGSHKALEHPLYRLLHDEPNGEMTSFVWRETMLSHLLLWGNAYCQIIRSGRAKIIGLYPLLPDRMSVDRDTSSGKLIYTYTTSEGKQTQLRTEDVLHIPGLGFDGIIGYSPIALEKNAIGLGISAEEYGSRFFQNGARPSGVLTHPNTVKDPKRLRESWNSAYGGTSNGAKVAVLEEGIVFSPISLPNNEAQFLETRKFQVEEICRIYRVPPHLVGNLDRATFSNIENQSIDFAVHTIRPWLIRIEQAMNRALFTDSEKGKFYTRFNLDGLMRGDYKSRMEGYAIARQNGWMSANDIRALENQNPIPEEQGGSTYLINGNMIPINLCGIGALLNAVAAVEQANQDSQDTADDSNANSDDEQNDDSDSEQNDEQNDEQNEQKKNGKKKSQPQKNRRSASNVGRGQPGKEMPT